MIAMYEGIDIEATCENLACFIMASGYTDKELAEILGTSVQSVNKWRHAHNLPDIENMYIISKIFGILIDDLIVPAGYRERKNAVCSQYMVSSTERIKAYLHFIRNLWKKSSPSDTISLCKIGCYSVDGLNLIVT